MNILKKIFISTEAKYCVVCKRKLQSDKFFTATESAGICTECSDKISFTKYGSSFEGMNPLQYVLSPMEYKGSAITIVKEFKFNSRFINGDILNLILKDFIKHYPHLCDFDCVIPVPLSKERFNERGFNQSEKLAVGIAQALSLPLDTESLIRLRNTPRQSQFSYTERIENVKDAFFAPDTLFDKKIILIDDIYTTGCTMSSCASALINAGAKSVVGVSCSIVNNPLHRSKLRPVPKPLLKCRSFKQIKNHFKYK